MNGLKEHDVRMMRYGCKGSWVMYTCHTCNALIDTGQTFFSEGWEKRKAEFLKNHPCKEIKDETSYRVVDYGEDS